MSTGLKAFKGDTQALFSEAAKNLNKIYFLAFYQVVKENPSEQVNPSELYEQGFLSTLSFHYENLNTRWTPTQTPY